MTDNYIYKILTKNQWNKIKENEKFKGTDKDLQDGFIHFSTKKQLQGTLNNYFKNQKNLIILKIKLSNENALLWEEDKNGNVFPHLYDELNLKDIVERIKT